MDVSIANQMIFSKGVVSILDPTCQACFKVCRAQKRLPTVRHYLSGPYREWSESDLCAVLYYFAHVHSRYEKMVTPLPWSKIMISSRT